MFQKRKIVFISASALSATVAVIYFLPFIIHSILTVIIAPLPLPEKSSSFTFYALGDQGSADRRQYSVALQLELDCQLYNPPLFALLLGDNFYWDGVQSIDDKKFHDAFEGVYNTPCLRQLPFYAILGNHDHAGNVQSQIDYSILNKGSGRFTMPARYYIRDFGVDDQSIFVRFVMIDTGNLDSAQWQFIRDAFDSDKTIHWKIVAGHVPIRSFSKKYGDNEKLKETLLPILQSRAVDLYLSGHAHNLQVITYPNEPLYIISGSGGKRARPMTKTAPALQTGFQNNGFVRITLNRLNAKVKVHSLLKSSGLVVEKNCLYRKSPTNHCVRNQTSAAKQSHENNAANRQ